jgi:hypothetical protein
VAHEEIFAKYPTPYYWTCYQSEWATDIVFDSGEALQRLMPAFIAHGLLSYHSHDVLRFFGKRTTKAGQIPRNFHGELQTSCKQYEEGERIKFWMDGNSAKAYSKLILTDAAVLRAAETTINNVGVFRTYRPAEGGPDDDLQWRKMRKGIADLHRRAEVSQQTNNRLIDATHSCVPSRHSCRDLNPNYQPPTRRKNDFLFQHQRVAIAVMRAWLAVQSDGRFSCGRLRQSN